MSPTENQGQKEMNVINVINLKLRGTKDEFYQTEKSYLRSTTANLDNYLLNVSIIDFKV